MKKKFALIIALLATIALLVACSGESLPTVSPTVSPSVEPIACYTPSVTLKPTPVPTPKSAAEFTINENGQMTGIPFYNDADPVLTARALKKALQGTVGVSLYIDGPLLAEGVGELAGVECEDLKLYVAQLSGQAEYANFILETICGIKGISELTIDIPGITSVEPIAAMEGLTYLSILSAANVEDFLPLEGMVAGLEFAHVAPADSAMHALAQNPALRKVKTGIFAGKSKPNDVMSYCGLGSYNEMMAAMPFSKLAMARMADDDFKRISAKPVVAGKALIVASSYPPNSTGINEWITEVLDATGLGMVVSTATSAWAQARQIDPDIEECILVGPYKWMQEGILATMPGEVETIVYIWGKYSPDGKYADGTTAFDCNTYVRVYNLRTGEVSQDERTGKYNGPFTKYGEGDNYAQLHFSSAYQYLEGLTLQP